MPETLGSVINMGNGIEHFFLTAIQMMFSLFLDRCFVEIEKVISDYLVRVMRCKFTRVVVFSQPGFSNKNRPVLALHRYLNIIKVNRCGNQFHPIPFCLWISITQNYKVRFCPWGNWMVV